MSSQPVEELRRNVEFDLSNKEYRDKLKSNKNLISDYTPDELKQIKKKSLAKIIIDSEPIKKRGKKPIGTNANGILCYKCDICGATYTAKNYSHHAKSKIHRTFAKMNDTMRQMILDN